MAPAVLTTALLATCLVLPALAAPRCSIDAIHGLLGTPGAGVTMRVSDNDEACGTRPWVRPGVISFTRLDPIKAPHHGELTLSDPTRFSYRPQPGYRGPDSFELVGFGDGADGSAVTGRLHVAVSVSLHR